MVEAEFVVEEKGLDLFNNLKKSILKEGYAPPSVLKVNEFKVLVWEDQEPVGIGLLSVDKFFQIDIVCVKVDKRNRGYGDLIVKMLIDKAFQLGARMVYVDCPAEVINFFAKIGFQKVQTFDGSGKMVRMSIQESDIKKCSS